MISSFLLSTVARPSDPSLETVYDPAGLWEGRRTEREAGAARHDAAGVCLDVVTGLEARAHANSTSRGSNTVES